VDRRRQQVRAEPGRTRARRSRALAAAGTLLVAGAVGCTPEDEEVRFESVGNAIDAGSEGWTAPSGSASLPGGSERSDEVEATPTTNDPAGAATYRDDGGDGFVETGADQLSTFAVDVDTASYAIARRAVEDGHLPDPASVRAEEFVNSFDPGFDAPDDGAIGLHVDGGPTPFLADRGGNRLVRVGLSTAEPDGQQPDAVSLTFVVDTSGSMSDKISIAKAAVRALSAELGSGDTVGVVSYGAFAEVMLEPTDAQRSDALEIALDDLWVGNSTNAEEGVRLGYEQAREAFIPGGVNRVVLISDGVANVGETGPEAILSLVGDRARDGIQLLTIGVGMGEYNDVLLEQLADQGDGFYAYVDREQEAAALASGDLGVTVALLAEEAKVQVEFDPAAVRRYRLVGFDNRAIDDEDFRDDLTEPPELRADAGELGAGHRVTALYEVELSGAAADADDVTLGSVRARWTDPTTGEAEEVERRITSGDLAASWPEAPARFKLAAVVAAWAEVLGEGDDARHLTLDDVAEAAAALPSSLRDEADVAELLALCARAAEL
jgi:Ca-activated chloride channel homolog